MVGLARATQRKLELAGADVTGEQLAWVDRRAAVAGLSRSQLIRARLLADEGACPECAIVEGQLADMADRHRREVVALQREHERELVSGRKSYETRIAASMSGRDPRIAAIRDEYERRLAAMYGAPGENVSSVADRRRREDDMSYG